MAIPFELITMLGSGLMSGLMTLWSQSQKAKQAALDRAITGLASLFGLKLFLFCSQMFQ